MLVEEFKSLKNYTTFGIDYTARFFVIVSSIQELKDVLKKQIHTNIVILGGGSNILLTKNIDALVIYINLKGIQIVSEDKNTVKVQVMAGENWHQFVLYCIEHNFGGIENLSLIPGNVGTAPIQNIGAYGVELKDIFESCKALSIKDLIEKEFSKTDMKFGYRDSIFKNKEKGNYIITRVLFKLTKTHHKTNIAYGAIQEELDLKNIKTPSLKNISESVIAIRESKLPDPKKIGNSGSFFKNPIVNTSVFEQFIKENPKAPFYKVSDSAYKIPAGWLIEKAGFKGKRYGDAGVHNKQALVLVNYGNATGTEILNLALKIQKKVDELFSVKITPEVTIF